MRTLILGLGNPVHKDDGVGGRVARELKACFKNRPDIEAVESPLSGLSLLDLLVGYDRAYIIDAMPAAPEGVGVGEVIVLNSAEFEDRSVAVSPHYTGLPSVLKMGRELKLNMPEQVTVIGIGVEDPFSFGEELSPELERAVPDIVERIVGIIEAG